MLFLLIAVGQMWPGWKNIAQHCSKVHTTLHRCNKLGFSAWNSFYTTRSSQQ